MCRPLTSIASAQAVFVNGLMIPGNTLDATNLAINDVEFLVLERDNRGIGVDDPAGARAVGSKRVFKIRLTAT